MDDYRVMILIALRLRTKGQFAIAPQHRLSPMILSTASGYAQLSAGDQYRGKVFLLAVELFCLIVSFVELMPVKVGQELPGSAAS